VRFARLVTVLLVVSAVVAEGARAGDDDGWNPWQGMERNGRIPAVEKPSPHPERWRYVPEGRIKPGNVFERFLISSFIAPFVFRDSDVGVGGGIALTDIDFREQRRQEFAGLFLSYTEEGQQAYTAVWQRWLHHREAPGGGIFQEERSFVRAAAGYRRTLTRRFFGFGDATGEGDETSYTDTTGFGALDLELALPHAADDWVGSVGVRTEWHDLGRGRVRNVPSTGQVFPDVIAAADGAWIGWLDTGLRWDTRDSQLLPYRGSVMGANVAFAPAQSKGDVGAVVTLEASHFLPVPGLFHHGGDAGEENPPTDTLAFHLETQATAGDLPFFALPTLGGPLGRGFIAGRFRDQHLWVASAEYRFWVIPRGFALSPWTPAVRVERLGLALFYDVGAVDDQWPRVFVAEPKHSGGVGVRITLERQAPFRVDVGFSGEGPQVSAGFGLAF
jgi:hypothetical protein